MAYDNKTILAAVSEIIKLHDKFGLPYSELHKALERIANVDSTVIQPMGADEKKEAE